MHWLSDKLSKAAAWRLCIIALSILSQNQSSDLCGVCASQESHSKQAFCTAGAGVSAFAIAAKLAGVPRCPLGDRHPGSASWGREAGPPFSSSSRLPASARLPQQPQGPSHPGKASTKHAHCTVCSVRRCLREYHTFAGLLSRVALPCGPSSLRLPLCALRLECSSLWICLLVSILHQIRISSCQVRWLCSLRRERS